MFRLDCSAHVRIFTPGQFVRYLLNECHFLTSVRPEVHNVTDESSGPHIPCWCLTYLLPTRICGHGLVSARKYSINTKYLHSKGKQILPFSYRATRGLSISRTRLGRYVVECSDSRLGCVESALQQKKPLFATNPKNKTHDHLPPRYLYLENSIHIKHHDPANRKPIPHTTLVNQHYN